MNRINKWVIIIAALLFILVLGFGLFRYLISLKEEPVRQAAPDVTREVKAEEVKYGTVYSKVSGTGRILSVTETDLIAEISGKILPGDVPLKRGSVFHKGDRLFTIYTEEARLALLARKSRFISNVASVLPDLAIDFPEYAKEFRTFFVSLSEEKPFPPIPPAEDEKLKIFLASRELTPEYYGIMKDELQLSRHTAIAGFDGTFTEVYLEAGAYAGAGSRVAHIIRTDELEAEVSLDRQDAQWIETGDKVSVFSDKLKDPVAGVVVRKSLFVDENTQSQGIYIRVSDTSKSPLLSGEYIHAEFNVRPVENGMEVPRNAIINSNEFFVIIDGRLEKRQAQILKINETTAIINGIEEGAWLVVQPLVNVMEGTMVRIAGQEKQPADPAQEKAARQ